MILKVCFDDPLVAGSKSNNVISKLDFFDKMVGFVQRHNWAAYTNTNTQLGFVGECTDESSTFYRLAFETGYINTAKSVGLYAKDGTTNYAVVKWDTNFDKVIVFKIHFDPDATQCATRGYNTPPKVNVFNTEFDYTSFMVESAFFDASMQVFLLFGTTTRALGYHDQT